MKKLNIIFILIILNISKIHNINLYFIIFNLYLLIKHYYIL